MLKKSINSANIVGIFLILCFLCLPFRNNACASPKKIVVSAAISLKDAFMEMRRSYEQENKGSGLIFNFGSSGSLAGQIEGGAPADLFASASEKYMDDLEKKGLLLNGTRSDFAANSIVLIVLAGSKAVPLSFEGLKTTGVRQIAVGNPGSVPAGRYAMEVLNYYKLLPKIRDKLIYGENVRQVLDYVARGEVDAGIVYSTDASIRAKEVRISVSAPEKSHKRVVYPIAVLKGSKNQAAARAFIAFVLSQEGQKILAKYGFRDELQGRISDRPPVKR